VNLLGERLERGRGYGFILRSHPKLPVAAGWWATSWQLWVGDWNPLLCPPFGGSDLALLRGLKGKRHMPLCLEYLSLTKPPLFGLGLATLWLGKPDTPLGDGLLGTRFDEERSETR
jgi:hypothetical protein